MKEFITAHANAETQQRKLQILTCSPYTIEKTANLFKTSKYLVKESRKLKKLYGIFPDIPHISKGKVITKETKKIIQNFYSSDEISRLCPGRKDCLSVKNPETRQKEHLQKRLVLMNLKEAFSLYRENEGNPIVGFSSFAALRPKQCILAGPSGTHTVCVCTYHQNAKLQISAIGDVRINYKLLMEKSVCGTENRNCMLNQCSNCPGQNNVKSFLEELEFNDLTEEIKYKQWLSVDRCQLVEIKESTGEFCNSLSKKISDLTTHHFVAQAQSSYLKNLKSYLPAGEMIVLGDFAENYSFIVQDEIQGYHWENQQCTVHPFVIYYKSVEGEFKCQSVCFLSPVLKHNTVMVYTFISQLIPFLLTLPSSSVTKIHYFSDGCAGQYKNMYNFAHIYHHLKDFGIPCEWNFFGTSHGKSACDGIGGTVKRLTAKASLQRTYSDQILSCSDMLKFCKENIKGIEFLFTSKEDILQKQLFLQERYEGVKTVQGTRSFHKVSPLKEGKLVLFDII